jgi:hypothetical protein
MELAGVVGAMVPIAFIAMIAAIVIVPRYFRSLERQKMAEALKAAIERGQSLPPDLVDTMNSTAKVAPTPARDLRTGIIWLAVALGFAAFGIAIGFEEPDATFPMVAMAAFPGFIGLAFIVLGLMNRNKV